MKVSKYITAAIFCFGLTSCALFTDSDLYNGINSDILTGNWQDQAGMISTFDNGKFKTFTPDTNEKLSEGNYHLDPENPEIVSIIVKSLVKGSISEVNCSLGAHQNKLYCTTKPKENEDTINSFELWRMK